MLDISAKQTFGTVYITMPYLIDGHNLIPKLGLRLDSPDDEMELVAILQEFCRLERRQVEVYFDGAPTPHAGTRKLGTVTAHFVPSGNDCRRCHPQPYEEDGEKCKKLDGRFIRPAGSGRCTCRTGRYHVIR